MDRYKDALGQMEKTTDDSHAEHLQATSCPSYHSSNYPSCHCSNCPNISLFKLPLMYISSFLGEKMKSWKVK